MRSAKIFALTAVALAAVALSLARGAHARPGDDDDDDGDGDSRIGAYGERTPGGALPPASALRVAGPPIGEVLSAAYRAAGLDRHPARSWGRRARVAGLVPTVTVRTGRNTSWQELDPDVDRGTTIEVRATWRLDRLVFDGRELQVASIEAARRRERGRLASRVIRAYYQWQRAASAAVAEPRWTLRAEEAAAELDALTDGWFGRHRRRLRPP